MKKVIVEFKSPKIAKQVADRFYGDVKPYFYSGCHLILPHCSLFSLELGVALASISRKDYVIVNCIDLFIQEQHKYLSFVLPIKSSSFRTESKHAWVKKYILINSSELVRLWQFVQVKYNSKNILSNTAEVNIEIKHQRRIYDFEKNPVWASDSEKDYGYEEEKTEYFFIVSKNDCVERIQLLDELTIVN